MHLSAAPTRSYSGFTIWTDLTSHLDIHLSVMSHGHLHWPNFFFFLSLEQIPFWWNRKFHHVRPFSCEVCGKVKDGSGEKIPVWKLYKVMTTWSHAWPFDTINRVQRERPEAWHQLYISNMKRNIFHYMLQYCVLAALLYILQGNLWPRTRRYLRLTTPQTGHEKYITCALTLTGR